MLCYFTVTTEAVIINMGRQNKVTCSKGHKRYNIGINGEDFSVFNTVIVRNS